MSSGQVPTYYINLDHRQDRREFMESQFAQLGITAQRVDAVHIADVPAELVAYHRGGGSLWRMNPGDLACGLSHQRTWASIAEGTAPWALVLEDDAILAPSILDFLDHDALARLSAKLIKLETTREQVLLGTRVDQVGAVMVRELCSSQMCSAAYIISRPLAKKLLADPGRDLTSIDRLLFGRGGSCLLRTPVLQAWPSPCIQLGHLDPTASAGTSDLHGTRAKPARGSLTRLPGVMGLHLDHAARLLSLAFRDPGAAFGKRVAVPFADDSS
ncbi:hypothetical protein ASC89_18805 [Devosia sp. Root413D1]|uniref:glycosyltransferase family 25 protein n=1 Tax=Devosia sp. Root413D1 TaxID=1736531 RepID=UPI0006F39C0A|nr:glycosyltransferase family 25 protein [Devosia sp. Root413D1]KQW77246.1 hypothetical protein ASC89_18805 [Devosia sp. Root413D1]